MGGNCWWQTGPYDSDLQVAFRRAQEVELAKDDHGFPGRTVAELWESGDWAEYIFTGGTATVLDQIHTVDATEPELGPYMRPVTEEEIRAWCPHDKPTFEEWKAALPADHELFPRRGLGRCTVLYENGEPSEIGYWGVTADQGAPGAPPAGGAGRRRSCPQSVKTLRDEQAGRTRVRHPIRVRTLTPALAALAAAGLLTGCLGDEPAADRPAGKAAPAPKAQGSLGAPGTACALPVSFGLLPDWKPKAVTVVEGDEFAAALGKQGPATMVCEIDAKPAGNIGFLRVWSAGKGPAQAALEGFVKAEENASKVTFNAIAAGGMPATEVTYTVYNKIMEESKEERAFAVSTPRGTVIIHLGGLDTQEHREMLPAYELARSSVKAL